MPNLQEGLIWCNMDTNHYLNSFVEQITTLRSRQHSPKSENQ